MQRNPNQQESMKKTEREFL